MQTVRILDIMTEFQVQCQEPIGELQGWSLEGMFPAMLVNEKDSPWSLSYLWSK
jgi:hypothetical protein